MEVPTLFRDAIVEHALEKDPHECCGLLVGPEGQVLKYYRISNAERVNGRYRMDRKNLYAANREIRGNGWKIQVIYQSHTGKPDEPSATDLRLATWPGAHYMLVSLKDKQVSDIRMFRIAEKPLDSIPTHFQNAMVEHALEKDPHECCGLLAGPEGQVLRHYPIANAITDPDRSPYLYRLDGKEYLAAYREIEDNGWDIQVIYHSHTHSPAYPSATDIRLATWPDAHYLLISLMDEQAPDIRMFKIVEEPLLFTEP